MNGKYPRPLRTPKIAECCPVGRMRGAYSARCNLIRPDAIGLVDGGTDIAMRGNEAGLGTPEEDTTSLTAVNGMDVPIRIAVCLGFGIDTFHGVCHAHFLENVTALVRDDLLCRGGNLSEDFANVESLRECRQKSVQDRHPPEPVAVDSPESVALARGGQEPPDGKENRLVLGRESSQPSGSESQGRRALRHQRSVRRHCRRRS